MNVEAVLERAVLERKSEGLAGRRYTDRDRHTDRDHDLVEAPRLQQPTATEGLVTRYGERAYRLASRITGDGQDAEEVVQDAFWTVVRKIDTFRGESAFGSWLYRIVANAAYQKLRGRQSRRHDISLEEVLPLFDEAGRYVAPAADWSSRVDDPSTQVELRTALTAAIDELPAPYRVVLVLRDVEGRSHGEIADVLGLNIGVVKTRVHRARLFLRKRLADCMTTLEATAIA
jgi:RNA polymerase sigma-70 factor, ECF subfamily